nr:VIT and VWA domain-containing protein [Pseudenhygromyxa sp. WMMC2535]
MPLATGCVNTAATNPQSGRTSVAASTTNPDAAQTTWLAQIEAAQAPLGPGSLEVDSAGGETTPLALTALRVDVHQAGSYARYEVEHIFENPGDALLEGTFRFPMPSGAIVTGLAMEVDGQLIEGEILERSRAREIYEEIVDSMRDPALLEWEAGRVFKLRVFPIQPGERKRVILRYQAAQVAHADSPSGRALLVPTAAPAMQGKIPHVEVSVDGQSVLAVDDHDAAENLYVPVEVAAAPAYVQERGAAGERYLAARVELDWSTVPAPEVDPSAGRRVVIVVDSSRSALESWGLAQDSVAALIDSLGPRDSFALVAADLQTRRFGQGFVSASAETRRAALAFLAAIEPDGASDLGAALDEVGALLHQSAGASLTQVVYVGDGTPTWGTTEPAALAELAAASLAGAPLHALSLGKRESRDTLESLSGASGGRTMRPESPQQARAFATFLRQAPSLRRLSAVELELPGLEGSSEDPLTSVRGPLRKTWFEGEQPVVHLRLPADAPAPEAILVHAKTFLRDEVLTRRVDLGAPEPAVGVRQQWAARELQALEAAGDKAGAVALSVEHGVLAKHTALLVLESEEAYERYQIERRSQRAAEQRDPQVSGRDLEGGDPSPYLGPGDLQPGDPEIHIPAARDAQSVEVVFPFGETKAARWEEALGQWTVRFLVDDDTEPGTYAVLVRITHADGHVEILHLDYTIDVQAPALSLELRPRDDGAWDVLAHQVLTEADAARERAEGLHDPSAPEQAATLDARRVELLMPDGQTLNLRRGTAGNFARRWQPRGAISWPATVSVVVTDRALNYSRAELPLAPPDSDSEPRR